jgi:anhydro-N-acetylmuramic acid kinase
LHSHLILLLFFDFNYMEKKNKYQVIGLMSGTSLDGLDIAHCELICEKGKWRFNIHSAITLRYTSYWKKKLSTAHLLSSEDLLALHAEYGTYLGRCTRQFVATQKIKKIDFISSHGHTIFHQPDRKFTFQLGDGNALHAAAGLPVVFDLRSLDVTCGGQGAPLVPIGDRYLFHQYHICLNLGGISNLSMEIKNQRKAFDICFVNMGLNYLAAEAGKEYDKDGVLASKGKVNTQLLSQLNKAYQTFRKKRPSLGREGFEKTIQPLLNNKRIPLPDRLRTFSESIAEEIAATIPAPNGAPLKLLATGGGALNSFVIQLLREKLKNKAEVIVPERKIIEFKEALVFALLGTLRVRNEVNALKSVTGASKDSSTGVTIGF